MSRPFSKKSFFFVPSSTKHCTENRGFAEDWWHGSAIVGINEKGGKRTERGKESYELYSSLPISVVDLLLEKGGVRFREYMCWWHCGFTRRLFGDFVRQYRVKHCLSHIASD